MIVIMYRLVFALLFLGMASISRGANDPKVRPNFVLIVTDDQDIVLKGLTPMKQTQQLIANLGATFINAYTSSPICCPSRTSILTGLYPHNHKTINNSVTGGCYGQEWQEKLEPKALPVLLSSAGYRTFYAGKYLNQYMSKIVPPGWSEWFGLQGNSVYYNYTVNENGVLQLYEKTYFTDYLKDHTINFLEQQSELAPFFAVVAPPAPHAPYTAADRHAALFPNVTALRTANFNRPFGPLEKHWLLTMKPSTLPDDVLVKLDDIYRKRWQSLMAVDEMVGNIINALEKRNLLENTYILFTSDNGYHIGQFAQPYDKRQPYETDIKVPFLVRGPGIAEKSLVDSPVALIDIAPSVLQLAGLDIPPEMDGIPVIALKDSLRSDPEHYERQILIEYWGEGTEETYSAACPWHKQDRLNLCTTDVVCRCQDVWNNTYHCVRHIAYDIDFKYCEFNDNENFVEAYDLSDDMYEMNNVAYDILPSIRAKYSLAIGNLSACSGATCHKLY